MDPSRNPLGQDATSITTSTTSITTSSQPDSASASSAGIPQTLPHNTILTLTDPSESSGITIVFL